MYDKITLVILLDAGRADYPQFMPYVSSLIPQGVYAETLVNPGGYCERSCFMTGAGPDVTGNYFAMSLMPIGYKRAYYEPRFNVPPEIRNRLCMTEDVHLDTDKDSFYNPDTGEVIESIWDVFRLHKKKFAVEACVALGVRSDKGKTTHGSRPIQLLDKIKKGIDVAYIQFSEIDQQAHVRGSDPKDMYKILQWADGEVEHLVEETKKLYKHVNILVFGDHGQTPVTRKIDLDLDFPQFKVGWDYMYLKSSAAVQFWVWNPRVASVIKSNAVLRKYGSFIHSPSKRQGDIVWRANRGILVSPCHFHGKNDGVVSMHGYNPEILTERGFAIMVDGIHKGEVKKISLIDLAPTICDMVGVRSPKKSEGVSLCIPKYMAETK